MMIVHLMKKSLRLKRKSIMNEQPQMTRRLIDWGRKSMKIFGYQMKMCRLEEVHWQRCVVIFILTPIYLSTHVHLGHKTSQEDLSQPTPAWRPCKLLHSCKDRAQTNQEICFNSMEFCCRDDQVGDLSSILSRPARWHGPPQPNIKNINTAFQTHCYRMESSDWIRTGIGCGYSKSIQIQKSSLITTGIFRTSLRQLFDSHKTMFLYFMKSSLLLTYSPRSSRKLQIMNR